MIERRREGAVEILGLDPLAAIAYRANYHKKEL